MDAHDIGRSWHFRAPILIAVLGVLALAGPGVDAGTVYKWTDADGQVHYGHSPPTGVEASRMSIAEDKRPQGESDEQLKTLMEKARLSPEQMDADRSDQAARQAEKNTENAQREAVCANARNTLTELENWAHRTVVRDEQGNTHRLDNVQREELIERTRRTAEANCR